MSSRTYRRAPRTKFEATGKFSKTRMRDRSPTRRPANRKGYSSVARTRGAAVTGEMKYFDTESTLVAITPVTSTWVAGTESDPETTINLGDAAVATPLTLFAPKVSAALNGRIGRQCKVLKIKVKGTVSIPIASAGNVGRSASQVRVLLVHDMQTNAAQMTALSLLNGASASSATINSFQNPNNFGRFRVLKDKTFSLMDPNMAGEVAAANLVSNGRLIPFKWNISFKVPIEVHFNAVNGGTVADVVDHSFHIIAGCQDNGLGALLSYYARVCYKE